MLLKLKAFFVVFLFTISFCEKKQLPVYQKMTCDVDYALNEVYYSADDELVVRLRYIWLSDSIGEVDYALIDSSLTLLNEIFSNAGITFDTLETKEIVTDAKYDMPSYIKVARQYNDKDAINIYVYADQQDNFSDDKAHVVGSAGGIPSTFFAIRKSYLKTMTSCHEMGHSLGGLYHIDTPDPDSTGSSSATGDKICDTPSSIRLIENITANCVYTGNRHYTPEELKIITCNIMSDAYSKCRGCFSDGQIQRMKWVIEQSSDLRATIKKPKIDQ